jgi:hypothetical protein
MTIDFVKKVVVSGVEWKSRGDPEVEGMLVVDAFKRHLTPEIKATVSGRSMNKDLMVIPGVMMSQLQVLEAVVNKSCRKLLDREWLFVSGLPWQGSASYQK